MARSLMAVTLISHVSRRTSAALHSDQQVSVAAFIVSIVPVPVSVKKFIAENAKLRAPQVCVSPFSSLGKLLISHEALEGDAQDLPASEFYVESSLQTASELATPRR
jgi:hypothetical protein